jgi:hypothetical protein
MVTKVAPPPQRAKTAELRIAYLEKTDDTHTKHVVLNVTDPTLVTALVDILKTAAGVDLAAADDAELIEV